MKIRLLTSTPLNYLQGSGTFAGVATLARALEGLGADVELVTPGVELPVYTATRLWFNERLRWRRAADCDVVVGFDMDGYRVAGQGRAPHIASIKGVLADEARFERGLTRLTMSLQAVCEAVHLRRADLVMTTSRYAAERIHEIYGLTKPIRIVPEAIELESWRDLFRRNPAWPEPSRFTVLSVCRFYPRKRLHLLLRAAARLRGRIPGLEVRIVGGGPERPRLLSLQRELRLGETVKFLGDLSQSALAAEYNRCDIFCLPSVQEGFGIVFLEAMAAGKPIVAVRAAAVPEVVEQGLLAEPESEESLAGAIERLYREPALRGSLAEAGRKLVERYDAPRVAKLFLEEAGSIVRAHPDGR